MPSVSNKRIEEIITITKEIIFCNIFLCANKLQNFDGLQNCYFQIEYSLEY